MEGQGSLRTDGNRQDRWAALQDEKEIDGAALLARLEGM